MSLNCIVEFVRFRPPKNITDSQTFFFFETKKKKKTDDGGRIFISSKTDKAFFFFFEKLSMPSRYSNFSENLETLPYCLYLK